MIGKLRDDRATENVIKCLTDNDSNVRESAVEALGEIGNPASIVPLCLAFSDSNVWVKNKVFETFRKFGENAVSSLIAALKDEDEIVRQNSSALLAKLQLSVAIEPLERRLADRNRHMRQNACYVLGELEAEESVDSIIGLLKDRIKQVRHQAAVALGKIGDIRALPVLKNAKYDQYKAVREAAEEAIRKIYKKNGL
jgi:HEAT repeat protein